MLVLTKSISFWAIGVLSCFAVVSPGYAVGPTVFVNGSAAPGGDGSSWAAPLRDLQDALELTREWPGAVAEIWVAEGTYKPDRGTGDRSSIFNVSATVAIYGGFAGAESSPTDRVVAAHPTVLSGDLLADDTVGGANQSENVFRLMRVRFAAADTVLDGLIFRGGNAQMIAPDFVRDGSALLVETSHASVRNCEFVANRTVVSGVVLFKANAGELSDCRFSGNFSAALDLSGTTAHVSNCDVELNRTGILCSDYARPIIAGCTFIANSGSCVYASAGCDITIEGCHFEATTGASAVDVRGSESTVALNDCVFLNNTGARYPALKTDGAEFSATNCVFDHNSGPVAACAVDSVRTIFTECAFAENGSPTATGGAVFTGCGRPEFVGCSFQDNVAQHGGAIYVETGCAVELDGSSTFQGNVAVRGGAIYNKGTLSGTLTTAGVDTVYSTGTIRPGVGTAVGSMTLGGLTTLPDPTNAVYTGNVVIDIAGTIPGVGHDVISVPEGIVDFRGGALRLQMAPEFTPELGQIFDVISAASVTGAPQIVATPNLPGGLFLDVHTSSTGIYCEVGQLARVLEFGSEVSTEFPSRPRDFQLADLDMDGFAEALAIVAGSSVNVDPGALLVFPNLGVVDGAWAGFGPPVSHPIPPDPRQMTIGRFNADAVPDVAIACYAGGAVTVAFGAGSTRDVASPVSYDQRPPNYDYEFNHDSIGEMSVTAAGGNISSTDGTLLNAIGVPAGGSLKVDAGPGLVNNDGGLRVVIPAGMTGRSNLGLSLAWRRTSGGFTSADVQMDVGGGFEPLFQGLAIPDAFAVLSIDAGAVADGRSHVQFRLEFHGASQTLGAVCIDNVTTLSEPASGGTRVPRSFFALNFAANRWPASLAVIRNEVVDDLVMGGAFRLAHILRNDGNGQFGLAQTLRPPGPLSGMVAAVASGDLDGNGVADITWSDSANTGGNTATCFFSLQHSGVFEPLVSFTLPGGYRQLAATDVSADGVSEVLGVNSFTGVLDMISRRASAPSGFATGLSLPLGANPQSFVAPDFDGDGDADLGFVVTDFGAPTTLRLVRNDTVAGGPPVLGAALDIGVTGIPLLVRSGDANGDGNPDLAVMTEVPGLLPGFRLGVRPNLNPPYCAADYNQDGGVDGSDVELFFSDWEAGTADINNDGGVDGSDVQAFFDVWEHGGC